MCRIALAESSTFEPFNKADFVQSRLSSGDLGTEVPRCDGGYAPRSLRAMSRRSSRAILCFSVLSGMPR